MLKIVLQQYRHIAAPDVCDGTSAVGESRHRMLAVLEQMKPADDADAMLRSVYIRDLRRKLGLGQPIEVIRAQTRERVRRRQAQAQLAR
jgi:hypothetical protein